MFQPGLRLPLCFLASPRIEIELGDVERLWLKSTGHEPIRCLMVVPTETCCFFISQISQPDIEDYKTGWWFGTFVIFHILGRIIPTDFHIFQRVCNHQPLKRTMTKRAPNARGSSPQLTAATVELF